jgi:two-component system, OmpR family, sensor histidine kinase VicK
MNNYPTQKTEHQQDFIGIVCHELKTPLAVLTGIVHLLNRKFDAADDQTTSISLAKASQQIKKMGNLVNGFLHESFLESGIIEISKAEFNLSYLIGEIVQETRSLLKDQYIVVDFSDVVVVNADREKIGCVLSNLFRNAAKYSSKGKCIYVKCFHSANEAIVRIRDEGMGIKPEDLDRLFDRYFRTDCDEAKKVEGFGIGLYLCSSIIKQHGGEIWAQSEPGNGATFYFSLPLSET